VILGLLPEIRGGLGALARMGQHSRFIEGYLRPYAAAFDEVRYFSYQRETLDQFTRDAGLAARVRVIPGAAGHPWLSTALAGLRHGRKLAECSVLRVFHLTGAIPALVARRRSGVPFATTYGFHYDRLARTAARAWGHRMLERLALARADAVIVTTPELAAYVADRVRSPCVVHLLPNGVDTCRFLPRARPASPEPVVLYVGRFSKEKNLSLVIAAAATLRGRHALRLRFVGDGPLGASLAREAARVGVSLELLPVVDHAHLPAVYAAADVFVLPSLTEGHAKALLEAMSCGLPCVASNVGGNRTVLDAGRTGLLVDPSDAGALVDALERLATDQDLGPRLGAAARREAVERYDLATVVTREIALLRALAGRHAAARC
jgi:glycosyltransferase involved in cell wall biosynthesis